MYIWLAGANFKCPIANRKADVVQTTRSSFSVASTEERLTVTHPAAAIASKSDSVIHVSQWFCKTEVAVALD